MMLHSLLIFSLFIVSVICTAAYRKLALHYDLLDNPNERSSHQIPTPRGAGLVFMLLWLLQLLVFYSYGFINVKLLVILLSVILIVLVSLLDDIYSLGARLRFLVQIAASLMSLWFLGGVSDWNLGFVQLHTGLIIGSFLGLMLLICSTNLFNFMDGLDGIAGVEGLFVLLPGSLWIFLEGGFHLGLLILGLSALIAGFLVWNWPKAKVFMGDSGSASLGFLIALFALIAQQKFHASLLSWFVLYGLFIFDATATLIRRIVAHEKWTQAHRLHAYQRLHQAGWSHAKVLSAIIGINSLLVFIASFMSFYPECSMFGFFLSLVILSLAYIYVERVYPMYPSKKSQNNP